VSTPTILDNLIATERIPPLVAVLVANVSRDRELPCYRPFADFLAAELVPWVRGQYAVARDPARVVVAGSSYGGLASTCAAMWHPDVFGNVLSQSGSYWWRPAGDVELEWVGRQIAERGNLGVRFYMDIGLLETGPTRGGGPSMLVTNRHLRDLLRATGHTVTYRELNSGHDYVSWRGTLGDGLIALIGRVARSEAGAGDLRLQSQAYERLDREDD
jgi:enterochelin esterase family protein